MVEHFRRRHSNAVSIQTRTLEGGPFPLKKSFSSAHFNEYLSETHPARKGSPVTRVMTGIDEENRPALAACSIVSCSL